MDTDDLERVLEPHPGAKLIYTVPDFQNPTGVTLSLARRRRLIELANAYEVLVLEDTPYRELRFEGEPPHVEEPRHRGAGAAPRQLLQDPRPGDAAGLGGGERTRSSERLGLLKLAADTQCSTLNMAAASAYLARYDIDAHIAAHPGLPAQERPDAGRDGGDVPGRRRVHRPDGGLFTWLTFPDGFDAAAFMRDTLLPEAKVAYVPGATFFPVDQEPNHARVSFSRGPTTARARHPGARPPAARRRSHHGLATRLEQTELARPSARHPPASGSRARSASWRTCMSTVRTER